MTVSSIASPSDASPSNEPLGGPTHYQCLCLNPIAKEKHSLLLPSLLSVFIAMATVHSVYDQMGEE